MTKDKDHNQQKEKRQVIYNIKLKQQKTEPEVKQSELECNIIVNSATKNYSLYVNFCFFSFPLLSSTLFLTLGRFQRIVNLSNAIILNRKIELPERDVHENLKIHIFIFTFVSSKSTYLLPMYS